MAKGVYGEEVLDVGVLDLVLEKVVLVQEKNLDGSFSVQQPLPEKHDPRWKFA